MSCHNGSVKVADCQSGSPVTKTTGSEQGPICGVAPYRWAANRAGRDYGSAIMAVSNSAQGGLGSG